MWSEYINGKEGMTDFILKDGKILYQITYVYSKEQRGNIADIWKYISPKNKPPQKIIDWVKKYMKNYTGICNVQYRGDKIIEIGLRFGLSASIS